MSERENVVRETEEQEEGRKARWRQMDEKIGDVRRRKRGKVHV